MNRKAYYRKNKLYIRERENAYKRKRYKKFGKTINAKNNTYRKNNTDKVVKWERKRALKLPRRFSESKSRARTRGLIWTISFTDYEKLVKRSCYYCKDNIVSYVGCGLDRKDNSLGYSIDNVLPCCVRCNRMRNVYVSVNEFKIMMRALLRYRKKRDEERR